MKKSIYIKGAEQVSIQKPLCEEWMTAPIIYNDKYNRSLDPDFKQFLSPIEARRMGKILKRALATSIRVIDRCGKTEPDAIITGTGLGCIENTELFLDALCREGEEFLKPTHFMQSTHNTISSLLAIQTKSHGYNVTYAHKHVSFDSALYDAYLQFMLNKVNNVLVGGHDEMTPSYFSLLEKSGYLGCEGMCTAGETAVSVMLSNNKENALCELLSMRILYRPDKAKICSAFERMLAESNISSEEITAIVTGINGCKENDSVYDDIIGCIQSNAPVLKYKHLFGESYTASGLGLYAAAHCMHNREYPAHMVIGENNGAVNAGGVTLLLNHSDGKTITLTMIRSIENS